MHIIYFFIILLVVLFILFFIFPVWVIVVYDNDLHLELKYFGIRFKILPSKGGSSNSRISDESRNTGIIMSVYRFLKENGILNTIKYVGDIFCAFSDALREILKRVKIIDLKFDLRICGSDAFDTSIKYGEASAVVYQLAGIVDSVSSPKSLDVNVYPDYNSCKSDLKFKISLYIRSFNVIRFALLFITRYVKNLKKLKI